MLKVWIVRNELNAEVALLVFWGNSFTKLRQQFVLTRGFYRFQEKETNSEVKNLFVSSRLRANRFSSQTHSGDISPP